MEKAVESNILPTFGFQYNNVAIILDRTVKLWLPGCGSQAVYSYTGHQGSVNSARLHPKEPLVLSAGGDGSVHIWRYSKERMVQRKNAFANTRNIQSSGELLKKGRLIVFKMG